MVPLGRWGVPPLCVLGAELAGPGRMRGQMNEIGRGRPPMNRLAANRQ